MSLTIYHLLLILRTYGDICLHPQNTFMEWCSIHPLYSCTKPSSSKNVNAQSVLLTLSNSFINSGTEISLVLKFHLHSVSTHLWKLPPDRTNAEWSKQPITVLVIPRSCGSGWLANNNTSLKIWTLFESHTEMKQNNESTQRVNTIWMLQWWKYIHKQVKI